MLKIDASRGVLYIVWGSDHISECIKSAEYVNRFGLKTQLVTDYPGQIDGFDIVTKTTFGEHSSYERKINMYKYSVFSETVYLDSDCFVLDNLDLGFIKSRSHGFAVSAAPPFYYNCTEGEMVHFNTGVLFFSKSDLSKKLFNRWSQIASSDRYLNGFTKDQLGFSLAIHELDICPYILPHTWNFRIQIFKECWVHGPIKVWHARTEPPSSVYSYNDQCKSFHGICDLHKVIFVDGKYKIERSSIE